MKHLLSLMTIMACLSVQAATITALTSPNGRVAVVLNADGYDVLFDGKTLVQGAQASLSVTTDKGDIILGLSKNAALKVSRQGGIQNKNEHIVAPLYRQSAFDFESNRVKLNAGNGFTMEWMVCDEGVAYRFLTTRKGETVISDESVQVRFANDGQTWMAYSTNHSDPYAMAFQNYYTHSTLSEGSPRLEHPTKQGKDILPAFLPVTTEAGKAKVTLIESDLKEYPGMFVTAVKGQNLIAGEFPGYAKTFHYSKWRKQMHVSDTESFIAKSTGARSYPWRILAITDDDCQMPVNNMVYALAAPSSISDWSWVKPGFSAWEWWNDWGLTGVDFERGINMETYRYYIDFASEKGLEYLILDEGWYNPSEGDMLTPIAALDLEELVKYAAERNVKLILWTVFNVLDDQLEAACKKYSEMGIAGFKVDFIDRSDQTAVDMIWHIAAKAAEYHLVLDYHGIFPPTGLNRAYPNVLNYEAVFGQEEVRWSKVDVNMPLYNVTFPFIRQMCGYTDYTPGAMRNATKADFQPVYINSMSMGTRAHQVATYIVFDSPLTMLCDAPTLYEKEKETTDFITSLPRIYDEERVLAGKIGEYVVIARRKGDNWYIAGLNNWDSRDVTVPLDCLRNDVFYEMRMFSDGVNADHNAVDYRLDTLDFKGVQDITIHLASGGGFAIQALRK